MTTATSLTIRTAIVALTVAVSVGCSSSEATDADAVLSMPSTSSSTAATPDPTTGLPTTAATPPTAAPIESLQGNYTVEVIAALRHDPQAYTQGLEWHDGWLYESTGQYESSDRRRLDPASGAVDLLVPLDDSIFGEGLTIVDDEILQLSWREGELLRSGLSDLETRSIQRYDGEGWGLCNAGDDLVMSDGSSTLTRRDPTTFAVTSTIQVTTDAGPLGRLNELECVGDQIIANVYGLDQVVVIDGTTGIVVAVIDASSLRPDGLSADDFDFVLNGLARQPESGHWFLTGKYWPVLYEVRFVAS